MTRLKQLAIIFIFVAAILPSLAAAQPSQLLVPEDIRIQSLSCTFGGRALTLGELEPLWNPSQSPEAAQLGLGPGVTLTASGSGEARLTCTYTFTNAEPWNAFEAEAIQPARIVSVVVTTDSGVTQTLTPSSGYIGPADRLRVQAPSTLYAKTLSWTIAVDCAGGSCPLRLAEVNIFPPTVELAPNIAPDEEGVQQFIFLPGDIIDVKGYADSRNYVCTGSRSICAWTMRTECKKVSWLRKSCNPGYDACPDHFGMRFSDYEQNLPDVVFTSSDSHTNGKCKSGLQKWGAKVLGVVAIVASLFTGGLTSTLLFAFGNTLMTYNPYLPLNQQWAMLAIAFASSLVTGPKLRAQILKFTDLLTRGLYVDFIFAVGKAITFNVMTKYVKERIFRDTESIFASILTSLVVSVSSDYLARGVADLFDVEFTSGLSYLTADSRNFLKTAMDIAAMDLVKNSINIVGSEMIMTTQKRCIEKAEDQAEAARCALVSYAASNALNWAAGQLKIPSTETVAYEKLSEEQQKSIVGSPTYIVHAETDAQGNVIKPETRIPPTEVAKMRIDGTNLSNADKEVLKNVIDAKGMQGIRDLQMAATFRGIQGGALAFLSEWQRNAKLMRDLEHQEDAMAAQLEGYVKNGIGRCGCYGLLRIYPQYLQDAVDCRNFTFSPSGRTISTFGGEYIEIGPPDNTQYGSPDIGKSWCRPPVIEGEIEGGTFVRKLDYGNATAVLKNSTTTVAQAQGAVENGALGLTLTAPAAGNYVLELNVTSPMPSATAGSILSAVLAFTDVITKGLSELPTAQSETTRLIALLDTLSAGGLSGLEQLRANVTALAGLFNAVANDAANVPADTAADFSSAKAATDAELAVIQSAKSRADTAGHATALGDLIKTAQNASSGFNLLLGGTNVLELLDVNKRAGALQTALFSIDSDIRLDLRAINRTAGSIAELPSETFDLDWHTVVPFSYWGNLVITITGTGEETVSFSDLRTVSVPYRTWTMWSSGTPGIDNQYNSVVGSQTYTLDTNLPALVGQSVVMLNDLYYATNTTAYTLAFGDNLTQSFLGNISLAKSIKSSIDTKISNLSTMLPILYGRVDEDAGRIYPTEDTIKVCSYTPSPDSQCDSYTTAHVYTLATDRSAVEKAAQSLRTLEGLSEALDEAINNATDAVWRAQVANSTATVAARRAIESGITAITDLLESMKEARRGELDAAISSTANATQALMDRISVAKRVARVEIPITVISPELDMSVQPAIQCGGGEQQNYNLSLRADITPLVIPVAANVWTPFSVPWIPKSQFLTLSELAPGCQLKQLAWWNASSQSAVKIESNAASVQLLPGRGYYVLTDNACELRFGSELFKPFGSINLTTVGNDVVPSPGRVLAGSSGLKMPFDFDSLSYKQNVERLWYIWPYVLNNRLNMTCPVLLFEIYDDFVRSRRSLSDWTILYEALPSADPFSLSPETVRFAEWIEPGKAYWILASKQCRLSSSLETAFPTTISRLARAVGLNISASLPGNWQSLDLYSVEENPFYGTADWNCDGTEPYACIGGFDISRTFGILPNGTGAFGEHTLTFSVLNATYGTSASNAAKYYLYPSTQAISSARTQDGIAITHKINVTNFAQDFCAGKLFHISTDVPPGWDVNGSRSAVIAPEASAIFNLSFTPRLSTASSGWMNIFVASDVSDIEKLMAGKIFEACIPDQADDITTGDGKLFYSTGNGIYAFNTTSCAQAEMIVVGSVRGIDYHSGKLFWIDGSGRIRSYDTRSGDAGIIATTSDADAWYVAADEQAVYWVDDRTVKRAAFGGTITTIAHNLNEPRGLDVDGGFVYWAEPDRIGKVSTSGSCSGSGCAAVPVPANVVPTSPGRFYDVAADGMRLWITADADKLFALPISFTSVRMNSSKIIGLDLGSNQIKFVYMPDVFDELTSVAADASYVYWIGDGAADRINKFTPFANVTEFLLVAGRKPAAVSIMPAESNTAAGTIARFEARITNNNSDGLPGMRFGLKDIQIPPELQLCTGYGVLDECEGDVRWNGKVVTQSDIVTDHYSSARTKQLDTGESDMIPIFVRPRADIATGTRLQFNVTAGSFDEATDGRASAGVLVTAPGPPLVVVEQISQCEADGILLPHGFVRPECNASFLVQITNPEALDADYALTLSQPGVLVSYWEASIEPSETTVSGAASYDNIRESVLDIVPMDPIFWPAPFGSYTFVLNVSNKDFPERYNATDITLIVTPDNRNGICEASRGERADNTPDCAINSEIFKCAFGEDCDHTVTDGVEFGIQPVSELQFFGVCNMTRGFSKNYNFERCKEEITAAQKSRLLCSASNPGCSIACGEQAGQYFLIANASGIMYNSSVFEYECPSCIGTVHSDVIAREAFTSGNVSFSEWLAHIKAKQFSADWWGKKDCEDIAKSIVDQGKTYENRVKGLKPSQCGGLRVNAQSFVSSSDALIIAVCKQGMRADLELTSMNVTDYATYGQPITATVEIENRAASAAFAKARCKYMKQGAEKRDESSCKQIAANATAQFNVLLSPADVGEWVTECAASWSTFEDCRISLDVDTAFGAFEVLPPATQLIITDYQIPDFGVQDREAHIRVDVRNDGEDANASVSCFVEDSEGSIREFESQIEFIGWSHTRHFFIDFRPDITGDWLIKECTVYQRSVKTPHYTQPIGTTIVIWPVCTSICEGLGWDFGGCFANASNTVGTEGQYGCAATEKCSCGNVTVTSKQCVRTGASGTDGIYNASVDVRWQTGDSLRIDTKTSSDQTVSFSKMFYQRGDYTINATVLKSFMPIYRKTIDVSCKERPLVNMTSPQAGAIVSGLQRVVAQFADAQNISLYVDDTLIFEDVIGPIVFDWNTADWADGQYTILAKGCNELGCTTAQRTIMIANLPTTQHAFTIDPLQFVSAVVAGQSVNYGFVIRNTGLLADSYVLSENLNTSWSKSTTLNGEPLRRTIILAPGEQALFEIEIHVPPSVRLNDSAALSVTARSFASGLVKTSGPHAIRVATVPNKPPQIELAYHMPITIYRGGTVTFYADLMDPDGDAITDAIVCKSPGCGDEWCRLVSTGGTYNCSISGLLTGNYSYYIFVRDSNGFTTLSSERTFIVIEKPLLPGQQRNIGDALSGAKATASSSLPGQGAANAIDDNIATYWISQSGLPQWLQVELQSEKWIDGIGIYSAVPSRPSAFDVMIGDCENFVKAYSENNARYVNGWYSAAFMAIFGKCVRLDVKTTEDGSDYASIGSLEIYEGRAPGTEIPGAPPVTCGDGVCTAGENSENCPADCPIEPGIPIYAWVLLIGGIGALVLWLWPRILLWWSYFRG